MYEAIPLKIAIVITAIGIKTINVLFLLINISSSTGYIIQAFNAVAPATTIIQKIEIINLEWCFLT